MAESLLLIDGHGLAFRGFYAVPETLTAPDGTPTNAIVGFVNMFLKALDKFKPYSVGLFFDPHGTTARKEMFTEYKAGRKPAPDNFKIQMPLIIELSRAMGVPVFIRDGVEADDYIVSTARFAASKGMKVKILSADKDLFQIIDSDISVIRPTKGISDFEVYDESFFVQKYGFEPARMLDFLSLTGDSVDNIPGVSGIGEKTAAQLIRDYGGIDEIYAHLGDLKGAKLKKLTEGRELAFASRALVVPLETEPVPLDLLKMQKPSEELYKMCTQLGLNKILHKFLQNDTDAQLSQPGSAKSEEPTPRSFVAAANDADEDFMNYSPAQAEEIPFGDILANYVLSLTEQDGIASLYSEAGNRISHIAVETLAASSAWREWTKNGTLYICGYRKLLLKNIPLPAKIFDLEAVHYMLHPDRGGASMAKTFPDMAAAGFVLKLKKLYESCAGRLTEKQKRLLNDLDMPLSPVLARMTSNGIFADVQAFKRLEAELADFAATTEKAIAEYTGRIINLNSPKQVAEVLFDQLRLPVIKKTKTGYSTGIEVLEALAQLPDPLCYVPKLLIEYREASKLLSSFVEPYMKLAEEGDGRIHSEFDQFATGTGRLASYSPNVQNIPMTGEWAAKLRKCIVPMSRDRVFVAADYSQIELRILAHLSGEPKLIGAFKEGRDVHAETASWVFDVPFGEITKEQRRFAKVVNFGLLYGMTAFGLAQRLSVTRPHASQIVKKYFSVFPGIQKYIDESIAAAQSAGFTESMFGRRRPLSEVSTIEGRGNKPLDRIAVNTPIQSAASDIAKMALLKFDTLVREKFKDAATVLQVHDSIVCECSASDADGVEKLMKETMENICKLSVPLTVETKRGTSLNEV